MDKIIIEASLNGDVHTILKGKDYSTSPREVVTIGDLERDFYKLKLNSYYGKNPLKGMLIDERI